MELVLINVVIGNSLDDTTRNEVLVCDTLDTNALNNLGLVADAFVDVVEGYESILSVRIIRPINISTTKSFADNVKSKCYSK
jgi:hypothetical protein